MKKNTERRINNVSASWNVFFNLILVFFLLVCLIPMLLVVIVSFSSAESIETIGYSFFPLSWSLDGYKNLLQMGQQLWSSIGFTIIRTTVCTITIVLSSAMYAYVISQNKFWLSKALLWFFFFTTLFSAGLVPSYLFNVRYYHLKDSVLLFFLGAFGASGCIMMRAFLKMSVQQDLLDAASIDGAGHTRIFWQIVLPLLKPGLGVTGFNTFVAYWNEWFTGQLYSVKNPKIIPLQTLILRMQENVDILKDNAKLDYSVIAQMNISAENLKMVCIVVSVIPIVIVFLYFQRYFKEGLVVGSLKG